MRDLAIGSYQTFGNNIAASASFMAFNWEHVGSSIAVLPLDDCGRKSKTMPLLHAHSDTVTDLDFSPFHDGLLASASQDCLVKVWHIPEGGLKESLLDAECTFSHRQKRVETVGFHPTSNCLLHSTSGGSIILYDLTSESEIFCNGDHPDTIQSLSWYLTLNFATTTILNCVIFTGSKTVPSWQPIPKTRKFESWIRVATPSFLRLTAIKASKIPE